MELQYSLIFTSTIFYDKTVTAVHLRVHHLARSLWNNVIENLTATEFEAKKKKKKEMKRDFMQIAEMWRVFWWNQEQLE